MLLSSFCRHANGARTRFAGAGLVAVLLLATFSTEGIADPIRRPLGGLRRSVTASPERVASASRRVAPLQDLIEEAARRFGVPASWIAAVMAVESRGRADALSPKGAIGLMQIMPETYAELRLRYGLGANPWNPRDNVLAGASYLRELYDRYGAPGFLAAYDAGPGRWDDYRLRGRPLAPETIAYLARLGPVVGGSAAPLPVVAASANPRSPFAAPIFVALSGRSPRMLAASEQARAVRTEGTNASDVAPADALFVTRPRAVEMRFGAASPSGEPVEDAPPIRTADAGSSPQPRSSNPLFPPRSSAEPSR